MGLRLQPYDSGVHMPEYDFSSLSAYDFELLSRDLLQQELGIRLESFKAGKDEGIDLRYAAETGGSLIVQCKHYVGSGYAVLIRKLKREELPKVAKLAPARYIVCTSVKLSPSNKDDIVKAMAPFCKSSSDVYGADDLNNLLSKYSEIEKKHFKLWLTSTIVLENILRCDIYTNTELKVGDIRRKIGLYVPNKCLTIVRETLAIHDALSSCALLENLL
jgi:hypothetical protein